MSKLRKLVKGDRVKITGPWDASSLGSGGWLHIGKFATVIKDDGSSYMAIEIHMDGDIDQNNPWNWSRENLRALPRKA